MAKTETHKYKEILKLALKASLGAIVVYYVLHSRMVDFNLLKHSLSQPINYVLAIFFSIISILCCSYRWFLLARVQGLGLSYKDFISLTMIGAFFNTFMPGSVGGDLVKAWYIAGKEPTQKGNAIFTVLFDRILGLAVIIFYSAFTLLFYTEWIESRMELKLIAYFIWTFTSASVFLGALFFLPVPLEKFFIVTFLKRWGPVSKVIDCIFSYRKAHKEVAIAILLSLISVLSINLLYYTQGIGMGIPVSLPQYFFIIPLICIFSAIPILPGGIGTGQVAFFTLFTWMNIADPEQGGALCTLIQIFTMSINSLGIFFYLRFKRHPIVTIPAGKIKQPSTCL